MSTRPENPESTHPATFTVAEMQDIADTLAVAREDIGQLIQVAKYNLRGQISTGEVIGKPAQPILVHEQGIERSEAVMERCRKTWCMVWKRIQGEEASPKVEG